MIVNIILSFTVIAALIFIKILFNKIDTLENKFKKSIVGNNFNLHLTKNRYNIDDLHSEISKIKEKINTLFKTKSNLKEYKEKIDHMYYYLLMYTNFEEIKKFNDLQQTYTYKNMYKDRVKMLGKQIINNSDIRNSNIMDLTEFYNEVKNDAGIS